MERKVAELYPAAPVDEAVSEPLAGRYRLRTRIGRGRLGDIYAATDERERELGVERQVALQLLPDAIAFDDARFAELKAGYAGLLVQPHPNVVAYHDIGRDSRFGYIVMEFLEGASLRKVLEHESPLPLSDASAVLNAVGAALDFLHARSITHGSVSAENVFVTDDLDFRLLDVVPLSAPQAQNGPLSDGAVADDVHDLACLAYEMLAGRHPFNFHGRAHAARAGLVPERIESLPAREWAALERALSSRGDDKPRTITEFLKQFGLRGDERLRPAEEPESRSTPQTTPSAASDQTFSRPAARTAPVRADRDPRRAKRPRETGSLLLFIVLIALYVWVVAGQPQADIAKLLDAVGPRIVTPGEPPRTPSPEAVAPAIVDAGIAASETAAGPTGPETAAAAGDGATSNAAVSIPDVAPSPTASARAPSSVDSAAADVASGTSAPAFDAAFVTVSESDAAVRLSVRLPEAPAARLYWWTRPHGAGPEQDYVSAGAQPVPAADPGQPSTLLVPLVNDGRPEPLEDFFVHVGARDATGRLVPADTIRVDIVDDD